MEDICEEIKFNSINIEEIAKQLNKELLNRIKIEYEAKDLEIRNSKWRRNKGWQIHGMRERQVLTENGLVIFKRTIYKNVFTNEYKCLVDPFLNINRNAKILSSFKLKILSLIDGGERQKDIIKMVNSLVSQSTISRLVNNYDFKTIYENLLNNNFNDNLITFSETIANENIQKFKNKVANENDIYIDLDDTWVNCKSNGTIKEFKARLASIRTGVENGRILNKRITVRFNEVGKTDISTNSYAGLLKESITKIYGDISDKRIFVCGDGATWIKKIANIFNAEFILDKFHFFAKIKQAFPFRRIGNVNYNLYNHIMYLIETENNIDKVIKLLKEILTWDKYLLENDNRQKIKALLNYAKSNINGIKIWFRQDICTGCYAESNISHFIKSILGYGSKAYTLKGFTNLVYLRIAKLNNIPVMDYFLEQDKINYDQQIEKIYNLKFYKFKETNKTSLRNINLPILNYKTCTANLYIRKKIIIC